MRYPEHEKLKALSSKRGAAQEFLDWLLDEKGVELAHPVSFFVAWWLVPDTI